MAISIDHSTLVITVQQSDCVLVAGTFYRLPTETVFRPAVNSLLSAESGMPLPNAISHNTEVTVAGVTYARFIELINGYSIQFTPNTAWSVELTESNNNLHDIASGVLVQNQVQVITTNAAGLVVSGSGVTQADKDDIENQIFARIVENGESFEQALRIMRAEAAGSIVIAGAEHRIKSADGNIDRIIATADETARTVTATDGT